MLGKFAVALLVAVSPAFAQAPAPTASGEGASEDQAAPVAYKTKRVCRSIEVVGSAIPRTTCTTKRIPIKPVEQESQANTEQVKQAEAPNGQ
jgi:hypothetical protein